MALISCCDRTRVLLRNQYLCWLSPEFLIFLSLFVCNYNELVEWSGGASWAACLALVPAKLWVIDLKVMPF
jgi:hypothetical protein